MRCVVTAGPAYEPIDRVRRLTNFSTGRLGTLLAGYLAGRGHAVTLLKGETATFRDEPADVRMVPFSSSADLQAKIQSLPAAEVDAFFHAAAVSDFQAGQVWRREGRGDLQPVGEGKISTRDQHLTLYLELRPARKIIAGLREAFPRAWLVGWKYEVDGGREDLLGKARRQLRESGTDACVVNGPAYGEGYGWVTPEGACRHVAEEEALFEVLAAGLGGR